MATATDRGARQVARSIVRSMSDADIAEHMEHHGPGMVSAARQQASLRGMARGERPDPSLVDRCHLPRLADVRRQATDALEQMLQGALQLRALSAGEHAMVDDMVAITSLARRTVRDALDEGLPMVGYDLATVLRREVAQGDDAWGDTFRRVVGELMAGVLAGTVQRLALRPETVVGAELVPEGLVA